MIHRIFRLICTVSFSLRKSLESGLHVTRSTDRCLHSLQYDQFVDERTVNVLFERSRIRKIDFLEFSSESFYQYPIFIILFISIIFNGKRAVITQVAVISSLISSFLYLTNILYLYFIFYNKNCQSHRLFIIINNSYTLLGF